MFTLNCKGRLLVLEKPVVMGIINVTPDSFYAGSRLSGVENILRTAEKMMQQGAVILDVGGQSTRPGSERLTAEEELIRVIGPVEAIHRQLPEAYISIDTYHAKVAREAVSAGAVMVNDISAGSMDEQMIPAVVSLHVPYVLMHMKGTPESMHKDPRYENVTRELLDFFIRTKNELHKTGITDIIIDPGFGFGKNSAQNFELLRNLSAFTLLQAPLLLGISRKSFIYKTLGITPEEALNGTTALHTIGLMNGASILRAHDVQAAVETIRLWEALGPV